MNDLSWIDSLSEAEAGAILKFKKQGIDSLSEEEAGLVLPHAAKLKTSVKQSTPEKQSSAYADIVNQLPRPVQGAIGGFEALGTMAASLPSMVEGFGRKVYSQMTSDGTEKEKRQKALEASANTFLPQFRAKSEMGKAGEELLGLIPQKLIEGAGDIGAEFVRGQTFLNDPTLKNTGQVEQKHGKEGIEAGRTFGELLAEGALLEPIVSGGVKAVKNFGKPRELSPELKAVQEEMRKVQEEQLKQPSKTIPEETTTHGAQLDLFRETPEEIIARQREQAKAESEGILRDAQGEQGDLFLGAGKEPRESIIPKDSKPAEVDAAWATREAEQKRLFDEDAQRFAAQQEPLTLEPAQGSSLLEKFSNDRTTNHPSPNAGKFNQGGAINPEVFVEGFNRVKDVIKDGLKGVRLNAHTKNGVFYVTAKDWAGKDIGEVQFLKNGDNIESGFTIVDNKQYKSKGLPEEMYKFAAELGNDIRASDHQTESGNFMWERFIENKLANVTPTGQRMIAKGQRGSIGFFGKESYEKFADRVRKQMPDAPESAIKAVWEKQQKESGVEQRIKQEAGKERLFKQIGADSDHLSASKLDVDQIISDLRDGPDSPPQEGISGVYEKSLMAQGYMPAEVSKNGPFKQAVRYLKSFYDANKQRSQNALFRTAVDGKTGGVIHEMNRLEAFNFDAAVKLSKQWHEAKGRSEYEFSLSPDQARVNQVKEKVFGDMFKKLSERLGPDNPISQIPNYIPSIFDGKFYGEARVVRADGTLSKPLIFSDNLKIGATNIAHKLQAQGFQVSEVKTRGNMDTHFGTAGADNKAANFQYYLDVMGDMSGETRELYNAISGAMQASATTTKGTHNRMKTWRGFKGSEGNKPWLSDKQNYYDTKRMIVDTIESFYDWDSAQEGAAFAKKILDPENKVKPNNRELINNYINDNIIGRRFNDGLAKTINDSFTTLGIDPKLAHAVSNTVGNHVTALMTAMGNGALALTNLVQPLTAVLPQMVLHSGLKAFPYMLKTIPQITMEFAYMGGAKQVAEVAKLFGKQDINIEAFSKRMKEKLDYANEYGITSPTIIDQNPLFNNRHVNNIHQFAMQGILTKPSEQAARWSTFSSMVDFYQHSGMPKAAAFERAREVTETYMVDYGSDARANIFKALGPFKELVGRIQHFSTTQWSTLYKYGKNSTASGREMGAFLTYLGTLYALGGIAGMPGFDIIEKIFNESLSKDGETVSLRNNIRQTVGDTVYNPFDSITGLGMSPSFAARAIDTSGNTTIPASLSMPVPTRLGEMASVVGRRLSNNSPEFAAETEGEKAREIQAFTPTSVRGFIEDAYLTPTVGDKERFISPKTDKVTYTPSEHERSLANIRSAERVKNTEISSEKFKESARLREDKLNHEKEMTRLALDMYANGNISMIKENRMADMITKYVNNYGASEDELKKIFAPVEDQFFDSDEIAQLSRLSKKGKLSLGDVKKVLFNQRYLELRNQ